METCFVCIIIHEWWRSVRRIDLNMVFQYIFFLYQKENRITKRVKKKWSWWKIRLIWNLQHLEWRYFYALNILQIWYNCSNLIIPHATIAEGIPVMFFDPSVSPVFFVRATPQKLLNRTSWNFVVMKYIKCRLAYLQGIVIQFFSWVLCLFWT